MKKALTVIKGKKGQHLNQREAKAISEGAVKGLLLFGVEQRGLKVNLYYDVEGLVPCSDFLYINKMNKRVFVVLLRHIVLTLKGMEDNRFSKDLLMWSMQSTYIDPATWHVYMMYVPLQPFEAIGNMKSFILEMVSLCNFEENENIEYVQALVQEANSVTSYTVGMLESYCNRISDELLSQVKREDAQNICTSCGSKIGLNESVCPFCGKQIGSHFNVHNRREDKNSEFWPTEDSNQNRTNDVISTKREIAVYEDENGVVTVFRGARNINSSLWLEDCEKSEKVSVSKFPFRIGKMDGVTDYRIFNNRVSRKHADIVKEQGKYYIVDLASTNGTYLNGRRLQPGVKETLDDGFVIDFADARFKIHID